MCLNGINLRMRQGALLPSPQLPSSESALSIARHALPLTIDEEYSSTPTICQKRPICSLDSRSSVTFAPSASSLTKVRAAFCSSPEADWPFHKTKLPAKARMYEKAEQTLEAAYIVYQLEQRISYLDSGLPKGLHLSKLSAVGFLGPYTDMCSCCRSLYGYRSSI